MHAHRGAAHQRLMASIGGVSPLSLLTFFAAAKKVSPAPDRGNACAPARPRGAEKAQKNPRKSGCQAKAKGKGKRQRQKAKAKGKKQRQKAKANAAPPKGQKQK